MRDYSKLLELAKENNGIIRTKMTVENKIPKDYLKFAIDDGVLEIIGESTLASGLVEYYGGTDRWK